MPFRNVETHFSKAPSVKIKRSAFKYNSSNKFTMNAGDLVPFLFEEVLPGDTFDLKLSKVVRLTSSLHPTMDNLYLDTYFFFVPNRFLWDNWQKFMGENDQAWTDSTVYVAPSFLIGGTYGNESGSIRHGKVDPQSILNYIGLPCFENSTKKGFVVNSLRFNAYCKIWNDWFRSENLVDECPFYKGDGLIPSSYLNAYQSFLYNSFGVSSYLDSGNSCLKVAKFADYFTRALPQPQKGADVLIPAGGEVVLNNDAITSTSSFARWIGVDNDGDPTQISYAARIGNGISGHNIGVVAEDVQDGTFEKVYYDPNGTLGLQGLEITVNNLRLAVQTQKLLERDARSGTRYIELVRGHFGVESPDLRLQRSEYLGGKRTLINMSEVIQTSESSSSSPLGNLAGRSLTTGIENSFIKSFTEHGYIVGVCCVRPDRTYSQGVHRSFFRGVNGMAGVGSKLDYYYPVLANIGEQPIYEREIFIPGSSESITPDDVFGYQEAWSEYRIQQGQLRGFMQPGITGSLASWTYADNYATAPILSGSWLYQGKAEIDRTLAIPSSTAPQFVCDFLTFGKAVRPMPVYSIPGLVDHN